MTSAPAKRLFDIDWLRGYICLCLSVLHFYNSPLYDSYQRLLGEAGRQFVWDILLGVESFFVLAGFMMAHMLRPVPGESVSVGKYLKRRFYRLLIPYWIAVLLYASGGALARMMFHRGDAVPSIGDVVSQLLLVQEFFFDKAHLNKYTPMGYWSMVSLEQFYLIWLGTYGICLAIFRRRNDLIQQIMAFLTLAICIGSLASWIWRVDTRFELSRFAVFLSLGMLLYWSLEPKLSRWYFWIALAAILAVAIETDHPRLYKSVITAGIFIPLARGCWLPDSLVLRMLSWCGKRAYSIYLFDAIAGIWFLRLTWRIAADRNWLAIPLTLGAIGVSLAAAHFFYRYVEKPLQLRARKIEYRRKQSAPVTA